jgi:hypothetical protein
MKKIVDVNKLKSSDFINSGNEDNTPSSPNNKKNGFNINKFSVDMDKDKDKEKNYLNSNNENEENLKEITMLMRKILEEETN